MIYFKITDKESEAWARHRDYIEARKEAFHQANQLREELGVDSENAMIAGGSIEYYEYREGDHRPTGMLVKKDKLVPNEKTDWGQQVKAKMESIDFPTPFEYMELIFGAAGEMLKETDYYSGCGLTCNDEIALIAIQIPIWENAREKDSFEIPEGAEEITASDYHLLFDSITRENDN